MGINYHETVSYETEVVLSGIYLKMDSAQFGVRAPGGRRLLNGGNEHGVLIVLIFSFLR